MWNRPIFYIKIPGDTSFIANWVTATRNVGVEQVMFTGDGDQWECFWQNLYLVIPPRFSLRNPVKNVRREMIPMLIFN